VIREVKRIRRSLQRVRRSRDIQALGSLYNRFHEQMLQVIHNASLSRIHDLLYVQTARVWMQFLPEMDLDAEIDVMEEEIDQIVEALAADSGQWFAEIRAKHMRMLLDRFNQHVTRPLI
jgi:DNA-binding GntR family transcriptional regulator